MGNREDLEDIVFLGTMLLIGIALGKTMKHEEPAIQTKSAIEEEYSEGFWDHCREICFAVASVVFLLGAVLLALLITRS